MTVAPWLDRVKLAWLDRAVLAIALVGLVATAATFPGFERTAGAHAILAAQLDHSASAPLWDALAGVAAAIPIGEPAGRIALLGAVIAAFLLLGVMRAARALLPRDPLAGLVGVALLVLAPPFRAAAATGSPGLLAALGCVWFCVALFEYAGVVAQKPAKAPGLASGAVAGMTCVAWAGVVTGCVPYLGIVMVAMVMVWVPKPPSRIAAAIGAVIAVGVAMWIGAVGSWPSVAPDPGAAIAAIGAGSAAITVGAGLLGTAFGVATGLANTKRFGAIVAIGAAAAIVVGGHEPMPLLALLAIGAAILPAAVVRVVGASDEKPDRRHWIALVAGVPFVGAGLAAGAALGGDDARDSAIVAAADLVGELPPGPALVVETHEAAWAAVAYEQEAAGGRPDLGLAPPIARERTDAAVVGIFGAGHLAASDVAAFGRLDPTRSVPRGRAFQLLPEKPDAARVAAPEPARYGSVAGRELALELAVARATYEAGEGRLDQAARAAGLVASGRFGAADLAVLAAATPTGARPAFFGFLAEVSDEPPGPWLLELLGDDLAWVGGLDERSAAGRDAADLGAPRRLHALWRRVWTGQISENDPAIAAIGPRAVNATKEMLATLRR